MTEQDFLKSYDSSKYPKPSYTADIAVFAEFMERGRRIPRLLLIRRKNHPFKDCLAFPGGFVEEGESAEEAASRELMEETGIQIDPSMMQQFRTFSKPGRDPRGWTVSTAFIQFVDPKLVKPIAGDDAKDAAWFDIMIGREPGEGYVYSIRLMHGDSRAYTIFRMIPEPDGIAMPRLEILESGGLAFDHGDIAAYAAAWLMTR